MTIFLDVAVVQIQSWLARTPHLRGRRGASRMIREATMAEAVDRLLANCTSVARRNTAYGDIDGVIALEILRDDAVDEVERHVMRHLRKRLPAAPLRSTRWEGQDSLDAHAADEPLVTHDWPAPVPEWPASKPCDWCRSWPASREATVGAGDDRKQVQLCEDCAKRHRYAGFTTSTTATLKPGVERDLLERWHKEHNSKPTLPDKFPDLALLGKENDNTHLATVYADGNAVGKLNKELRDLRRNGIGTNFDLPQAISNATWSALLAAIEEMSAGTDEMMPVIAHLVGGDDVLVSIPAHEAWWFTRTLQITFQDALAAELADAGLADLPVPTVSAAIVFHHKFSPLPAAVDLAGELLAHAKKQHRGQRASLAWQDITHDGPYPLHHQAPGQRQAPALDALIDAWADLDSLAELGASARANLAVLARHTDPERVKAHAERLGLWDSVQRFLDGLIPLEDALGMVRWWRTE